MKLSEVRKKIGRKTPRVHRYDPLHGEGIPSTPWDRLARRDASDGSQRLLAKINNAIQDNARRNKILPSQYRALIGWSAIRPPESAKPS